MAATTSDPSAPTCFVVMGFGKKTDFETGRVLDLDMSYQNMIKPAVEAAGLTCIRADEIVHSGVIDLPMYQQLLSADVVVADVSTSNNNAYYELGVRHALRPFTTIIVAEDGIKAFPFDINHVAVRKYHHLGEDIGSSEARRFQKLLTEAIQQIMAKKPADHDSPVYTLLNNLTPPALQHIQAAVVAAADATDEADSAADGAPEDGAEAPAGNTRRKAAIPAAHQTHAMLMEEVDKAQLQGNWLQAKTLLEVVRSQQQQTRAAARKKATVTLGPDDHEDPYLLQRLALATYKSQVPTEEEALQAARDLLAPLDPDTSNDTETLGLWGAIHKRRWNLARSAAAGPLPVDSAGRHDLDEAVRAYERGFYLRNDYYNGINFAFMLNVRAAEATAPAEDIADYVQAQRVRREVLSICQQWRDAHPDSTGEGPLVVESRKNLENRYWVLASQAEAYVGLGQEALAQQTLQEAYALGEEAWMPATTETQLAKLRTLLQANPLRFIQPAASTVAA